MDKEKVEKMLEMMKSCCSYEKGMANCCSMMMKMMQFCGGKKQRRRKMQKRQNREDILEVFHDGYVNLET